MYFALGRRAEVASFEIRFNPALTRSVDGFSAPISHPTSTSGALRISRGESYEPWNGKDIQSTVLLHGRCDIGGAVAGIETDDHRYREVSPVVDLASHQGSPDRPEIAGLIDCPLLRVASGRCPE
jgi:hypothetical protein